MVWNHQDFARELRRQLVEIASIRKRVEENADLLERLTRLEESNHYLLRRLQARTVRATSSTRASRERCLTPARAPRGRVPSADVSGEPAARIPVQECFQNLRWKFADLTRTAVEAVRLESRRRDPGGS